MKPDQNDKSAARRPTEPTGDWLPFGSVIAASALAWAVIVLAVPMNQQDIPLNDDWAYSQGAIRFAHGEGIHYDKWAAMPLLGQWLWATPFVRAFGGNHVVLRTSVIVLSWFGLWGLFDLLRQGGAGSRLAAVGTMSLAVCPLYFLLEGTFMSDVPALSFSLLALALYGRAFASGRLAFLAFAFLVACLAVTTRQNTCAMAAVAMLWLWRSPPLRSRAVWQGAVLLPLALGIGTHFWLRHRPDSSIVDPIWVGWPTLREYPFRVLMYVGLAGLPLAALFRARLSSGARLACLVVMILWAASNYWRDGVSPLGGLFPYGQNMITTEGAFTRTFYLDQDRPHVLTLPIRYGLTAAAIFGATHLMGSFVSWLRWGCDWRPLVIFGLLVFALLLVSMPFDRYWIFLIPGGITLMSEGDERPRGRVTAGAILLAYAAASVTLMHDWLTWQGARWELGRWAMEQGIAAKAIEGGIEWDGDRTDRLDPSEVVIPAQTRHFHVPDLDRYLFPITGEYGLSSTINPGAEVLGSRPYTLWLSPGQHTMYLLAPPGQNGRIKAAAKRR
jgi:hypothetical protein